MRKTWRQWFKAGQLDHLAGKPIAYPKQPDYVEGYQSVLVTSKEWDATARAAAYSEKSERDRHLTREDAMNVMLINTAHSKIIHLSGASKNWFGSTVRMPACSNKMTDRRGHVRYIALHPVPGDLFDVTCKKCLGSKSFNQLAGMPSSPDYDTRDQEG